MVRIISFSLCVAVISLGFVIVVWTRLVGYRQSVENVYQRAFTGLCASISGIDYSLQKSLYSNSPVMLASLSGRIYSDAASAVGALSELPFTDLRLNQTSKFLSQVGDYAYALSRRAASNDVLTEKDRQTLSELSKIASELNSALSGLSNEIHDRKLKFSEILNAEKKLDEEEDRKNAGGIAGSLLNLEQEFKEFPSLIYDGPFSEHITRKNPAFLEGRAQVSRDYARRVAAKFLNMPVESIEPDGETNDKKIPAYSFHAKRDGADLYIDVTKVGGIVLSLIDSCEIKEVKLTPEQAIKKAVAFLAEQGFGEMRESYWTKYYNRIEINFAATSGDIILYPDLIQVAIALDTGNVCNFKAIGYIMNHKPRTIPFLRITANQAREMISPALAVVSQRTALIPTAGEYEILAHELLCRAQNGTEVLVYIDAVTGSEVDILLLRKDENGTLTV
jgi:germination protein YpeB